MDAKLYSQNCNLVHPPLKILKFVENMGTIFDNNFESIISERGLVMNLSAKMSTIKLEMADCFPREFFTNLFLRMRIHYNLKSKNVLLKTRAGRDKLKKLNCNPSSYD